MGQQADGSIVIRTLGDLVDFEYNLTAYCDACHRTLDVNAAKLAEIFGLETNYVHTKFPLKCAACGSKKISYTITPGDGPYRPYR